MQPEAQAMLLRSLIAVFTVASNGGFTALLRVLLPGFQKFAQNGIACLFFNFERA